MTSIVVDLDLKSANTSQAEGFVHKWIKHISPEMAFNTGLNLTAAEKAAVWRGITPLRPNGGCFSL